MCFQLLAPRPECQWTSEQKGQTWSTDHELQGKRAPQPGGWSEAEVRGRCTDNPQGPLRRSMPPEGNASFIRSTEIPFSLYRPIQKPGLLTRAKEFWLKDKEEI